MRSKLPHTHRLHSRGRLCGVIMLVILSSSLHLLFLLLISPFPHHAKSDIVRDFTLAEMTVMEQRQLAFIDSLLRTVESKANAPIAKVVTEYSRTCLTHHIKAAFGDGDFNDDSLAMRLLLHENDGVARQGYQALKPEQVDSLAERLVSQGRYMDAVQVLGNAVTKSTGLELSILASYCRKAVAQLEVLPGAESSEDRFSLVMTLSVINRN